MGITNLSFSATNINVGLDADKIATPRAGDMYLATDTEFLYKCYTDDSWTSDELTELKIDAVKPNIALSSNGSYTGNGSANRAIPHGLGVVPKLVLCTREHDLSGVLIEPDNWSVNYSNSTVGVAVTAMDNTNFYIDSSYMNSGTKLYHWVAVA